jgi:hypothetical protein
MTAIRAATAADALAIAAVHVASWDETYHGLLSEAVIAENTEEHRFIHAEALAAHAGDGGQAAYGWSDLRNAPTGTLQ